MKNLIAIGLLYLINSDRTHQTFCKNHLFIVRLLTTAAQHNNQVAWPAMLEPKHIAQVAELVDAQVSGTCGREVVEVRVFSWAPYTSLGSH